jgi:hypothetical protein
MPDWLGTMATTTLPIVLSIAVTFTGSAFAQDYRGQAVPRVERANPIEFSRLRFLTFTFGREGPMDTPLATPPVRGREYFVEADIFGIESARSVRFDLVDAAGVLLQTLSLWKASDGSADGEFYGFINVPDRPFRVVVSGTDSAGASFRSVLDTLFQPLASSPPDQPMLPPGISAAQSNQLQDLISAYRQELKTRSAQATREHPNGVIPLDPVTVSAITFEPFDSSSGAPIGIRLRYSIRFPERRTIAAIPHVFPVYQLSAWRGVVTMKPLAGTITPAPGMIGVQSLQEVILYNAQATYEGGVNYNFTVDLIPDYVIQGRITRRFCVYSAKFTDRTVWNAILASPSAVPYTVSISDTETNATIPAFFPQRTLYANFVSAGASDCGPTPTNRF